MNLVCVMAAPVAVEDKAAELVRTTAKPRHAQGIYDQRPRHALTQAPAHYLATEQVCCMSLRTRSLPTRMPRASSSFHTRGQP